MNLPKIRAYIAMWIHGIANAIDSSWGKAGFNAIYYQGEELKFDKEETTRGRVVTVTAPPEYNPDTQRSGGRMVRRMPRQLKKIKDAQEKAGE